MGSPREGHELGGIQAELNNVVQHGQNRSSGEDDHKQHDKSELNDLQPANEARGKKIETKAREAPAHRSRRRFLRTA